MCVKFAKKLFFADFLYIKHLRMLQLFAIFFNIRYTYEHV